MRSVRSTSWTRHPGRPARLLIAETIPAGHVATRSLGPGEAARIMTGAPLPQGADTVAQSEITSEEDGYVLVYEPVKRGKNIRRAGEDVPAGDRVLAAGTALGPAEIGVLASLGYARVLVHRRPRVAIISTGSELVEVDQPLGPGQIRNSNSYSLRALCRQMGVEATPFGIVPDDYEATRQAIEAGARVRRAAHFRRSLGRKFDFVKDVQDELGVERRLWGVAMKPGKPLVFGVRGGTLVFGLPGNPVSAMVSFELFVRPALASTDGVSQDHPPSLPSDHRGGRSPTPDGRIYVVRVRAWREDGTWHISSTGAQGLGHAALHGGRQRAGLRTRWRPGRAAPARRWISFCCAKTSRNPDSSLNAVSPPVVSRARWGYNENDEGVNSTTARGR